MDFLKIFLRNISLLPSLVQGVEALYGAKSGAQKKDAALAIVSASIHMGDAAGLKQIADADKFTGGLNLIVDGVVECLNASLWAKPEGTQQTAISPVQTV
jgi:acid phosphatase family membrane protein YuiD